MKESKLIEMKNKVEALTRVVQQLITELQFTREVAVGTLETIKLMPDYEEALDKLKKEVTTKDEDTKKAEVQVD
jgi:peptidyl-tRNA hydrolase